jgi:glycerate kinase
MIIIAPTAFKGTIPASAAARAMAAGARAVTSLDLLIQPLSDGGPGLIDALHPRGGALRLVQVRGPLGDDVAARILVQSGTAIIESADACGLHLVPEQRRDPTQLDTFGVGQLIRAAAGLPVDRIVVGLGGSATVDGGVGMAAALEGQPVDLPVIALADVDTLLRDAARVFAPQKGATPAQVQLLEAALLRLIELTGIADFPGAGAAGGLAYGLRAFLQAEVVPGSEWVLRETGLLRRLADARAVVTGEGSYDAQSFMGKITGTVVRAAQARGIPVLVVAGHAQDVAGYGNVVANHGALLGEADLERLVRIHLPALLHS